MHPNSIIIAALVLLLLPFQRTTAKGDDQGAKDNSLPSETTTNCYNPSDPNEIRLWEGRAPDSSGDDPKNKLGLISFGNGSYAKASWDRRGMDNSCISRRRMRLGRSLVEGSHSPFPAYLNSISSRAVFSYRRPNASEARTVPIFVKHWV
jgi:hypothetical protein